MRSMSQPVKQYFSHCKCQETTSDKINDNDYQTID